MKKVLLSIAVLALAALPAFAQSSLTLDIKDGLVTLDAKSTPVRLILTEWAKVGGTKVVGADKITGAPITLKLENLPERQALEIILRNVAGYMAAPRLASAAPGASSYDRILILPTSANAAPSNANARPPATPAFGAPNRGLPRPPGMAEQNGDVAVMQPDPPNDPPDPNAVPNQPVFTFPQPQGPNNGMFVPGPGQNGFNPNNPTFGNPNNPTFGAPGGQPQITLQPNANGQPMIYNFMPNNGVPPPANGGFTVIGSPTPGMVQQPQPAPGQPVPPRPPGGR